MSFAQARRRCVAMVLSSKLSDQFMKQLRASHERTTASYFWIACRKSSRGLVFVHFRSPESSYPERHSIGSGVDRKGQGASGSAGSIEEATLYWTTVGDDQVPRPKHASVCKLDIPFVRPKVTTRETTPDACSMIGYARLVQAAQAGFGA